MEVSPHIWCSLSSARIFPDALTRLRLPGKDWTGCLGPKGGEAAFPTRQRFSTTDRGAPLEELLPPPPTPHISPPCGPLPHTPHHPSPGPQSLPVHPLNKLAQCSGAVAQRAAAGAAMCTPRASLSDPHTSTRGEHCCTHSTDKNTDLEQEVTHPRPHSRTEEEAGTEPGHPEPHFRSPSQGLEEDRMHSSTVTVPLTLSHTGVTCPSEPHSCGGQLCPRTIMDYPSRPEPAYSRACVSPRSLWSGAGEVGGRYCGYTHSTALTGGLLVLILVHLQSSLVTILIFAQGFPADSSSGSGWLGICL